MGAWYWFWLSLSVVVLYLILRSGYSFVKSRYHFKISHLVIITDNNQQSIEWLIRSYYMANHLNGWPGKVTCLDVGSKDDTLRILTRLKQPYPQLQVVSLQSAVEENIENWIRNQRKLTDQILVLDLRETDLEESSSA